MSDSDNNLWELRPGIQMDQGTLESVAQIACALKSLSVYASLVMDQDDCPPDLQRTVDDGIAAINKLFVQ
jgi:hypothetical protein